jgi:hypothetical protein
MEEKEIEIKELKEIAEKAIKNNKVVFERLAEI